MHKMDADIPGPVRAAPAELGQPVIDLSFVEPRLAVGSAPGRRTGLQQLPLLGITHVIDCRAEASLAQLVEALPVVLTWLPVPDDGLPKPDGWFHAGIAAADQVGPGCLAVVCASGMERAPAMTYAILRHRGASVGEALAALDRTRPGCLPLTYQDSAEAALSHLGVR